MCFRECSNFQIFLPLTNALSFLTNALFSHECCVLSRMLSRNQNFQIFSNFQNFQIFSNFQKSKFSQECSNFQNFQNFSPLTNARSHECSLSRMLSRMLALTNASAFANVHQIFSKLPNFLNFLTNAQNQNFQN